eukprot:11096355-Alexandrium_andersonii.AAC.1
MRGKRGRQPRQLAQLWRTPPDRSPAAAESKMTKHSERAGGGGAAWGARGAAPATQWPSPRAAVERSSQSVRAGRP